MPCLAERFVDQELEHVADPDFRGIYVLTFELAEGGRCGEDFAHASARDDEAIEGFRGPGQVEFVPHEAGELIGLPGEVVSLGLVVDKDYEDRMEAFRGYEQGVTVRAKLERIPSFADAAESSARSCQRKR
mmetsp:Transcript_7604/g.18747  ORF Transcript_7604/g.18747 Transcript_7604/m.18747 type:complete len:131 (-) Transcript_7604:1135-1527(-)